MRRWYVTLTAFLTDRLPARTFWRALIFIPVLTSWVVVSYLFAYLFNSSRGGLANELLSLLAGHTVQIDWLQQTWTANGVIWLLGIWKGIGWSFVLFLAALDVLPHDPLEAARVDGAGEFRIWRKIILPEIRATTMAKLRACRGVDVRVGERYMFREMGRQR